MYLLLTEPLDWKPAEMKRRLEEAGFDATVCPHVAEEDDAAASPDRVDWAWCEISPSPAPAQGEFLEISRGLGAPPQSDRQFWTVTLPAVTVAETVSLSTFGEWEQRIRAEQWADALARAILDAHPEALVTNGAEVWSAAAYREMLEQREYTWPALMRRKLPYPRGDVQEVTLPLPTGCHAFTVRLAGMADPFGVVVAPEAPLADAEHTAALATIEAWLSRTETAFSGVLQDPERNAYRRKVTTAWATLIDSYPWPILQEPRYAGRFMVNYTESEGWLHIEYCSFSEFAACFPDEMVDRWLLILAFEVDWERAPHFGEAIRRALEEQRNRADAEGFSWGEQDGIVGVWDAQENLVFSMPRAELDLGEYLRQVVGVAAVSLTPWIACVPFTECRRAGIEIPSYGNFIWVDVAAPPSLEQLAALDLAPAPGWSEAEGEWPFCREHAARWMEAFGSRFFYLCHDDDILVVRCRDDEHTRRLAAYPIQRACAYRAPEAARTPLPREVVDLVLAQGAANPYMVEPFAGKGSRLHFWKWSEEWGRTERVCPSPEEMTTAHTIAFDAEARRWHCAAPSESALGAGSVRPQAE